MKIVVINLAGEEARWAAICRQLASVGLEAERFEAVVGSALSDQQLAALYSPELNLAQYHKPLQLGEIGCYASHLTVWHRLLESSESRIAVFEDDIDVDPDLPQTLRALERGPQFDMVKLIGRRSEAVTRRLPLAPGRQLVAYRRVPGLTSAYVIHRSAAEKLLANRLPFGRPIDVDLRHWWECDLRVQGVWPYPVRAAPSSLLSTIGGRRSPSDHPTRLRKMLLQARYSVLNWQARHAAAWHALPRQPRPSARFAGRPAR